jgi:copper chaperone CopZ
MKKSSIFLLLGMLIISEMLFSQADGSMDIYFPTTGNCVLCKIRIENTVNKLNGIEEVTWDFETDVTYVTYDDTQTDAHEIMQVIAYVGHETEWYPASDSGYAALQGTCCLYTKVIDYSNVQVGYLGLMGIWVWSLTDVDDHSDAEINLVPGPANGLYSLSGSDLPDLGLLTCMAYTLNGQRVFSHNLEPSREAKIDLRHLNGGYYIVVLSNREKIIHQSKIYKH